MNIRITSISKAGAVIALIAFGMLKAGSARAQDQPQEPQQQDENGKPKPAAHAPMIDNPDEQDTTVTDPNALHPDTTPLTGAEAPGLGTVEYRHSYWVPGFQVATTAQNGTTNGSGWFDTTYLAGNLSLLENWSHSRLALNYSGGGYFSTDKVQGDGTYQQLAFVQSFQWRRWQLQFVDQFSYLPTTAFGFGGLSNIAAPGVGGSLSPISPGLGSSYIPNQTVLSSNGPQYSNTFATQATFEVSPRGSITLVGSYGLLRFTQPGNIDNDDEIGSVGYNYAITRNDSLGLLYRFTAFHFTGLSQAIGDNVVNLAYGRKLTGRLAVALFAGPEITTFRVPVGNQTEQTGVSFGANMTYGFERGSMVLSYAHGTNGGSGILAGATGDNLNITGNRRITRVWSARGNFGYGRSHAFSANGLESPGFNSFYVGAGLDRPIGRDAIVSFGYTAYIESTNQAACGKACSSGATGTQHQIAVGFQWHTRPFVLR